LFNKISFDENKTKDLLDALAQYTQERDDKKGMFKNNPKHDWTSHAADSFRYLMGAYHFMNTSKPKEEYKPVFSKIT
jgi:hypothetical protein